MGHQQQRYDVRQHISSDTDTAGYEISISAASGGAAMLSAAASGTPSARKGDCVEAPILGGGGGGGVPRGDSPPPRYGAVTEALSGILTPSHSLSNPSRHLLDKTYLELAPEYSSATQEPEYSSASGMPSPSNLCPLSQLGPEYAPPPATAHIIIYFYVCCILFCCVRSNSDRPNSNPYLTLTILLVKQYDH